MGAGINSTTVSWKNKKVVRILPERRGPLVQGTTLGLHKHRLNQGHLYEKSCWPLPAESAIFSEQDKPKGAGNENSSGSLTGFVLRGLNLSR
jgi:hypothetical protein